LGVLELDRMGLVESVLCHCRHVRLPEPDVPVVSFQQGPERMTGFTNVDLNSIERRCCSLPEFSVPGCTSEAEDLLGWQMLLLLGLTCPANVFQGGLHVWKGDYRGWFPIGSSGRHGWIEGLTYPFLAPSILPESILE